MAGYVSCDVKGLAELEKQLKTIGDDAQFQGAVIATKTTAQEIARIAKRKVPVDTGNLKKSIRWRKAYKKRSNWVKYIVGHTIGKDAKNNGWYGRLVEFGVSSHLIPKKILKKAMRINNFFVRGQVTHPGIKPQPYMRPAFDEGWRIGLAKGAKKMKKIIEKKR